MKTGAHHGWCPDLIRMGIYRSKKWRGPHEVKALGLRILDGDLSTQARTVDAEGFRIGVIPWHGSANIEYQFYRPGDPGCIVFDKVDVIEGMAMGFLFIRVVAVARMIMMIGTTVKGSSMSHRLHMVVMGYHFMDQQDGKCGQKGQAYELHYAHAGNKNTKKELGHIKN